MLFLWTFPNISYFISRSFNICGKDRVCCRHRRTSAAPIRTTATPPSENFNFFDLNNITNLISTILHPVVPHQPVPDYVVTSKPAPVNPHVPTSRRPHTATSYMPAEKCVSKKGVRIEKRILIDEEDYDDSEYAHVGVTEPNEYPWMVALLKKNSTSQIYQYKCGGVLSE